MRNTFKHIIALSYAACFTGYSLYLLFNHKARFWLELDLAPFIPWLKEHPLITIIAVLTLIAGGSYFDRLLMTEGIKKHPILAFILAGVLLILVSLLYAIYITTSHYTFAHGNFYITALIIFLGNVILYLWLKARF